MKAHSLIDAGVCGFHTTVVADSPDKRHVTCYGEVDKRKESVILATAVETMAECRKSCAVPLGVFKAMQVVTGLALPKDVHIEVAADKDDAAS